jgi:hypothetical protein
MPRELPRRELDPPAESTYRQEEQALKQNKKIENTRSWTGIRKERVELANDVVNRYTAQFKTSIADLKSLADFGGGISSARTAAPWGERAFAARGDLPGFWNDFKQEVATRTSAAGNTPADVRLKQALDWLEMAEREGGLGTWLEQWKDMLGNPWSWDTMANSADKIKQGIEYCKTLVDEAFGDLSNVGKNDPSVQNRADLHYALDAIASEIAREADTLLGGKTLDLGKDFDAIRARLKEQNPRELLEERLHTAFEKGTLTISQQWMQELPQSLQQADPTTAVSRHLRMMHEAARDVETIARDIQSGNPPGRQDQINAAGTLDQASLKLYKKIADFRSGLDLKAYTPDKLSEILLVTRQLARETLARQERLAAQLSESAARKTLVDGTAARALKALLEYDPLEPAKSIYFSCQEYAAQGKLADFWRDARTYVDKAFRQTGGPDYNPQLADALDRAFSSDLGNMLQKWNTRQPETTYKDAWELIATLRSYKRQAGEILAGKPNQLDFMNNVLTGIAGALSAQMRTQ